MNKGKKFQKSFQRTNLISRKTIFPGTMLLQNWEFSFGQNCQFSSHFLYILQKNGKEIKTIKLQVLRCFGFSSFYLFLVSIIPKLVYLVIFRLFWGKLHRGGLWCDHLVRYNITWPGQLDFKFLFTIKS